MDCSAVADNDASVTNENRTVTVDTVTGTPNRRHRFIWKPRRYSNMSHNSNTGDAQEDEHTVSSIGQLVHQVATMLGWFPLTLYR